MNEGFIFNVGGSGGAPQVSFVPVSGLNSSAATGSSIGQCATNLPAGGTWKISPGGGYFAINASGGVTSTGGLYSPSYNVVISYSITLPSGTLVIASETFTISVTQLPKLPALSISNTNVATGSAQGTVIGTISGVLSGDSLTISPNDGRIVLGTDGNGNPAALVGPTAASAGSVAYAITSSDSSGTYSPSTTTLNTQLNFAPSSLPAYAYEAETTTLINALNAVGTSNITARHAYSINRKIKRLKAAGLWGTVLTWYSDAKFAQNEAQWLINWISPSQKLTKVGSPTFTAGVGVSTTAITSYYDTGVALNSLSQNSAHIGVYSATAGAMASTEAGAQDSNANGLEIICDQSTGYLGARCMSALAYSTSASAGSFSGGGHNCVFRSDANNISAAHRGPVQEVLAQASASITTSPTLWVLAANGNTAYSKRTLTAYHHGAGMTAAQSMLLGAIINEWNNQVPVGEPTLIDAGYDMSAIYGNGVGATTATVDLAVFGTTFPAICAAYAAKRFNPSLRVALFAEESASTPWRLGGMLAQGLGWPDLDYAIPGANKYVSGIWRDAVTYINTVPQTRSDPQPPTQPSAAAPPNEWNALARRMLDPTKTTGLLPGMDIPVYYTGQGITFVSSSGTRVTGFTCGDGRRVTCSFLIGADYLGTPLPLIGIPNITGREAAGAGTMERQNGYQLPSALPKYGASSAGGSGTASVRVNPYVTPTDPTSGLIADIHQVPNYTVGQAYPALQSMNFRLFLTKDVTRKAPINIPGTPPAGYNATRYERHGRGFAAAYAANVTPTFFDEFANQSINVGSGYDFNNGSSGISTDVPGSGTSFAAQGSALNRLNNVVSDGINYTQGLMYWLQNSGDSRIPQALITSLANYYLDATVFTDPEPYGTLYWPDLFYPRDNLFRMKNSGAVLTGDDCIATDGTAIRISAHVLSCFTYGNFDAHAVTQVAYDDGSGSGACIYNQGAGFTGSVGGADGVVPLPMEVCWPDNAVCSNFATPTYPSMTEVAYCAYRLEPCMGVAAEAIGIAAAMSIANNADIQAISYSALASNIQSAPDTHPIYVQTTN